jgi:hypothetical protein
VALSGKDAFSSSTSTDSFALMMDNPNDSSDEEV